jgi:predicted DNA-binding transcriptional regulator YafY
MSTCGRVDPYGIVNKAGSWFLVGYCHELEAYRGFNTAYIKEVRLTNEGFDRDPSFDLRSFWTTAKPQ